MEYNINKGIGKSVEFKGLKAQYLFIFAGGLLAVFIVFVVMYMAGVDQWVCIGFGVIAASVLVWLTFNLNAKYGEHGLMKLLAKRQHPRFLINRKNSRRLFQYPKRRRRAMRNTLKAATIESKFPLLSVEHDCIISKDADITVAYRVDLPELFTVTGSEYEAIHSAWTKAIKVLPDYSVIHKQDWFIKEKYKPSTDKENMSFLSRSFERHFNERPFLNHTCFLFLTKTTKERMQMQSNFSSLCRGNIIPKEVNKETALRFMEAVGQFERIVNDSGFITLTRLTSDEITGTEKEAGLIEKYFALSLEDTTCLEDLELGANGLRIGDKTVCLHTISDVEDLPGTIGTDMRYEKLSTDRSDCRLSFAAPVGLLLSCDHVYNQYIFLDDSAENLRKFEKSARNMQSLSKYSRGNQINKEWIDKYLNEAHSFGLTSVRAHFNVMAWSDDEEELKHIRNDVGSQLALMECKPRHNTVDAATLYWAGMPGNAGDFPSEESFYTFIEPALCFLQRKLTTKVLPHLLVSKCVIGFLENLSMWIFPTCP